MTPRAPRILRLLASLSLVPIFLVLSTSLSQAEDGAGDDGASGQLHDLLDRSWQSAIDENPLLATDMGVEGADHMMPDASMAAVERRHGMTKSELEELRAIDRDALEGEDRISYDVFEWLLQSAVEDHETFGYQLFLTADYGFHVGLVTLPRDMNPQTTEDYENYLARLHAFPTYFDQQIALLRAGLEAGRTLSKVVLDGYDETISAHVVADDALASSPFWAPFETFPEGVPADQHERLRTEAEGAVAAANGAYRSFLRFMVDEYMAGARESVGASAMPGGMEHYEAKVRYFTTLDLTADEVHQIGLGEVARIRAEMESIIEEVEFEGTFDEFLHFLRTDPQFYAKTPEELLKQASYLSKKMDGKLPSLFGRLPRQPYGVEPVPDFLAPKFTGGRYVSAPLDSTRAGTYWVNTYALESRPLYVLESLTLHEAVPGHHLQGALTQELEGLPMFRRQLYISAYGEGWGLYSERLGLEAGFYEDPYSNFGRLTYEMWRACRLVVDTGLHAKGWTRQQAMDYLASNTALSLHEVRTETDRYISWPGQALAYKIGELKIRELRAKAEKALGADFDIRSFHDRVLGSGSLPLPVLERVIDEWIATESSRSGADS